MNLVLLGLLACSDATLSVKLAPPSVSILTPENGYTEYNTNPWEFRGLATQSSGSIDDAIVSWSSNIDGQIHEGTVETDGITSFTYTLSGGEHEITLRVIDSNGEAATDVVDVTVLENAAPIVEGVEITPENPTYLDTLTASIQASSDPDGEDVTVTWTWEKNETAIPLATSATLTPENFEIGDVLVAIATPNDGIMDGQSLRSESVTISDIPYEPNDDSYLLRGNCVLNISIDGGVLSNDVSPNGTPMEATIATPPQNGDLELNLDGSFQYTPYDIADDSFAYSVGGIEATVTLIGPSSPIIVDTSSANHDEDGLCSLREAVSAANLDAIVDGCVAGSGFDTIIFGLAESEHNLDAGTSDDDDNLLGDIDIHSSMEILGCGVSSTEISGGSSSRLIQVHSGAELHLYDVQLSEGGRTGSSGGALWNNGTTELYGVAFIDNHVQGDAGLQGSNAGGGGGGAAAMGGGIFNDEDGILGIYDGFESSLFSGNSVQGGYGAAGKSNGGTFSGVGGSGGGLFGGMGGGSAGAGDGGFASGGGGGAGNSSGNGHGGDGGFGGGGGGGGAKTSGGLGGNSGQGGFGGGFGGREGCSAAAGGGGGAGFGGAIFNSQGQVDIIDARFEDNQSKGGPKGGNPFGCGTSASDGGGYGGAIFNYLGQSVCTDCIYTGNIADSDGSDTYDY